jgi:ribonuclease HII
MRIGIDEAGRGPVIGSLFVCAYCLDESLEGEFRARGVRDSKLLSPSKRAELFEYVAGLGEYASTELTARTITAAMRSRKSLNELEAEAAAECLKKLPKAPVMADSPDPLPEKFARRIKKYFNGDVCAENKADANHVEAAAASIIAKELRERHVSRLKKEFGDFGSGYPSDPKTKAFLEKRARDPALQEYLRLEWETMKRFARCKVDLTHYQ